MQTIYLVLSFDHELSLGRVTTSYADNLFRPTDAILDVADECAVPITLFTDVLCGIRHREWGVREFVEPYEEQSRDAVRRGHEVELHLHPHWLDVDSPRATQTPSRYSLHDFKDEPHPRNIPGIVDQGVGFLTDLCRTVDPSYAPVAFRAGGFAICPSTAEILTALARRGIRIDSSTIKGYRFSSELWSVDFRHAPADANWFVDLGGPIDRPARSGIFEVPIVSVRRSALSSLGVFVRRARHRGKAHRPTGIPIYAGRDSLAAKVRRQLVPSSWMLTFDLYFWTASNLVDMLADYVRRHRAADVVYASVLSHPKNMGPSNVRLMREFVELARKRYGESLQFCRFRDIDRRLGLDAGSAPSGP